MSKSTCCSYISKQNLNCYFNYTAKHIVISEVDEQRRPDEPFHQTTEPFHQTTEPFHQPTEPIHQPTESIHQPTESIHQPAEPIHQPAEQGILLIS